MRRTFNATSHILVIVAIALALSVSSTSFASNFQQPNAEKLGISDTFGRWPDAVVPYVYNPTGAPAVFADDNYFITQFQAAVAELEGVSGISFDYQGIDSNADISDFNDDVVVVGWASLAGAAGQAGPQWICSAQNLTVYGYCPYVDGSVIFDNGGSTDWDKGAADFTERDFQQVAAHELLHLVGIGHSEFGISIMYADPYTNLSHPRQDDIGALQGLYGEPDLMAPSPIYDPPGAGAALVNNSYISLSDNPFIGGDGISEIDGTETAMHVGLAWSLTNGNTDDLTLITTDPQGYYYQGRLDERDCSSGTCWASFATTDAVFTFPGVWTVYLIYNGDHIETESITVTTIPLYNEPPDSTLQADVVYGPAPLAVSMTLDVTGDNEGDNINASWHIEGIGQIELDSGNFPGSAGDDTQNFTFDTPGEYEVYVVVNDDWLRYGVGGNAAGDGFRTLYRRVVRVTKRSDDVTALPDVTSDMIPDVAAHVGNYTNQPQINIFSGADRSLYNKVKYLSSKWRGIAVGTVRDANQDGNANDPALTLLADHKVSGKVKIQTRRADNDAPIKTTEYRSPSWRAVDVAVIDDTNGDGNTNDTAVAVLLQHKTTREISVQIRDLDSGLLIKNISSLNAKWIPRGIAVVDRSAQGNLSPLIGVLAEHRSNGKRRVESRLVSDGSLHRRIDFLNATHAVKDVTVSLDANGDGIFTDPVYQVLAMRDTDRLPRVQSRFSSNGALDKTIQVLNSKWEPFRIDSALDMNGNLSQEIAVAVRKRADNMRRIHVKDYDTKGKIINIDP